MTTVRNKLLWLGSYQSEESFQKMLVPNIGQASSFASQKGLVKGIDKLLLTDYVMDSIGSISFVAYPQYPKKHVDGEIWSRTGNSYDELVPYFNIKYLNYLSRQKALRKAVKQWGEKLRGTETNTVIVYEPGISKLESALELKRLYGAKVYVIIPDIPELVSLGANKLVRAVKKWNALKMRQLFDQMDGFILYSKHMADYYNLPNDKWIVMEGVFDPDEINNSKDSVNTAHPTRIMYCGVLDEFRGVPQLLDAFSDLKDRDYELWLTGSGRSEKLIQDRMQKDKRIKYYGFLASRNEVIKLENQADILIHTRDVNSPAAPYCFPSKLFEYLATGNQVLSVRIPGIPDKYFDYMTAIDSLTAKDIKKAIDSVLMLTDDERKARGAAARNFIISQKNSVTQAKKIMDFIGIGDRDE